jgi:acetylornithine deacetylase
MSELINLLSDLVKIDSVNPDLVPNGAGEAEIAQYIADWGTQNDLEVIVQDVIEGRTNVILIARGSGNGKSLMLNAHTDTVGVSEMDTPFTPVIQDGQLYGRGAYDMKSGLAACMIALKQAKDMNLSGDVILSAVVDEEYASIGTQAIIKEWERWLADAVIITEPTELDISITHKGFVWLDVEVFGKAAHGSRPHLGIDAIAKMGKVLVKIDELDQTLRANPTHDLLHSGSLHASTITGGEDISMYPAYCKLIIERRTIPNETPETVQSEIQAILDEISKTDPDFTASVNITLSRSPFGVDVNEPIVQLLRQKAQDTLKRDVSLIGTTFWMDAALFSEHSIPTAVLGPHGEGAHAKVEWVDLESVQQCVDIYMAVIGEFCK